MTLRSKLRRLAMAGPLVAAALSIGAGIYSPSHAQELSESHLKAAREALTASKATDPFDNILPSISEKLKTDRVAARPDLSEAVSQIIDTEALKLAKRRGDLERESARIYAATYTEEELKEITAFFGSPTGQKFLGESTAAAKKMGDASRIWAAGLVRDLTANVTQIMKDKGHE